MDSRGNSECYSSGNSSPIMLGSINSLDQTDQRHFQEPLLTPPNSPKSPIDDDDEFPFVTARTSVDDGLPTVSHIGPFIQTLTELIGQLQSLEEAHQQAIQDVVASDNYDKIQHHLVSSSKKEHHSPSVSNLFSKRRRSKDRQTASCSDEIVHVEQARQSVVQVTRDTIVAVRAAKKRLGQSLPSPHVYANALRCATSSTSVEVPSASDGLDWPYLLGRCFNLSVNLKILQGHQFNDSVTAGKCYADLNVLESQMEVYWLNVRQGSLAEELARAAAAKRQMDSTNITTTSRSSDKSSLCLKPVRRLLKLSPLRL